MSKIFNKKISPACKYCIHSTPLSFTDDMVCKYKGVTESNSSCRKYKYDPLKRQPSTLVLEKNYSKSDFEL